MNNQSKEKANSSQRIVASSAAGPDDRDYVFGANNSPQDNGCCAIILTVLAYILVILFFPFSLCATIKVVQEYERAVIFRLGRLLPGGAKGPGIFFVMPCIEEYTKVDLRTVSFDVPPQEVLTRDSVTVSVDAVVYYRISSPTVSVANVENAANSTQLLAQTTLRNVLGTQNLAEILSNREHISEQMQNVLDDATDKWGIKVERVEIKDVRLPTQLQRAMAAEAEAARDARAKVIAAEGEQKASVALKEAADIIEDVEWLDEDKVRLSAIILPGNDDGERFMSVVTMDEHFTSPWILVLYSSQPCPLQFPALSSTVLSIVLSVPSIVFYSSQPCPLQFPALSSTVLSIVLYSSQPCLLQFSALSSQFPALSSTVPSLVFYSSQHCPLSSQPCPL
ncbi:Mechanosensory protein 2 [Bulinus truncatus]|nr:Mechanosensory protein 2 [Bulinus truncatus]